MGSVVVYTKGAFFSMGKIHKEGYFSTYLRSPEDKTKWKYLRLDKEGPLMDYADLSEMFERDACFLFYNVDKK